MRDLARQDFSSNQTRNRIAIPKSAARIVFVMAFMLIILFGVKFVTSGGLVGDSSISVRDAPLGLKPVEIPKDLDITGESTNLIIESASFTNVGGENAVATATRKYGDGSYTLSVNATLPDPRGNVYQVWIVGENNIKLAGDMNGSRTNWSLTFNDKDKYSTLDDVWITREITNNDQKPEKHILEGTF